MGFNAQAFATAFLQGQAVDIKERFDKAEKFREEELKKAERNLGTYKKKQAQKKTVLQMANTLKDMGVDPANIMYYAKDGPQSLQSIYNIVTKKNNAIKGVTGETLPPEKLNEMMAIPQGFEEAASEYGSLSEFLERAYSLSNKNDEVEKPENAEIMQGNWLMGLMGYGAKEKERQRLETEKYIGDVSIAELNRMAGEQDFADPFGGAFTPASIDPSVGPRVIDDNTRIAIIKHQRTLEEKYTTSGAVGQDKINDFLQEKGLNTSESIDLLDEKRPPTDETSRNLLREFKERMKYEAYKDASVGFHRDDAEMSQISPEFLALHEKYGAKDTTNTTPSTGQVTSFSTIKAFKEALDNKSLKVGDKVTVMTKEGAKPHTITAEDLK